MMSRAKVKTVISSLLIIGLICHQGCSKSIFPEKMVPVNTNLVKRIDKTVDKDIDYLTLHFGPPTQILENGSDRKIYVYLYRRVDDKEEDNGYITTDNGVVYKSLDHNEKVSTNKQIRFWTSRNKILKYQIHGFRTEKDRNKTLRTIGILIEATVYTSAIAFSIVMSSLDFGPDFEW